VTREEDAMQLTGIHHLSAISAKPRDNLASYTGLLGMRQAKKTVNQDDVSAYHLSYAGGKANPGSSCSRSCRATNACGLPGRDILGVRQRLRRGDSISERREGRVPGTGATTAPTSPSYRLALVKPE